MKSCKLPFSTTLSFSGIPPYSFELSVHKPAGWSLLTPFEIFENGSLWTVMRVDGRLVGLKLFSTGTIAKPEIRCVLYSDVKLNPAEKSQLMETTIWMLSLDEDLKVFYSLARKDPLVKAVVKDLHGMRSTNDPNLFSALILAVTLQMAPISRSNQMMQLLIKKYGESVKFDGKEILYWPSPETIATVDVKELQENCKLGYRAKVLRGIAEELIKDFPSARKLERMSSDEAKEKLMELKGIGEYSAEIVSPHEGFPLDVWSAKVFSLLLHQNMTDSPRDEIPRLKKIAEERWGEWRGYLFVYVLNDLENLSRKFNMNLTRF